MLVEDVAAWDERPRPGRVGRLVDADPCLVVDGGVGLAGADVHGVARGIAGVDQDRADRVRVERAVMNCQCMLAPPSRALSDVQTPPPAAPTYRRQLFSEQ